MDINWDSKVLKSLDPVIDNLQNIRLNEHEIINVADWIAYEEFPPPEQNISKNNPEEYIRTTMLINTLNFAFTDFESGIKYEIVREGKELSDNANYRTRGSGMSVFADKSIGVGVGLLKTGQQTHASLGDNVGITINGGSGDVEVAAVTSENQGVDEDGTSFRSYASSEGIAGAGGGELGIAGSLSLVVSLDSQSAKTGDNVQIVAPGDVDVRSSATNKIVNRAWAIAVASDVTCDNPGNGGGSGGDTTAPPTLVSSTKVPL